MYCNKLESTLLQVYEHLVPCALVPDKYNYSLRVTVTAGERLTKPLFFLFACTAEV